MMRRPDARHRPAEPDDLPDGWGTPRLSLQGQPDDRASARSGGATGRPRRSRTSRARRSIWAWCRLHDGADPRHCTLQAKTMPPGSAADPHPLGVVTIDNALLRSTRQRQLPKPARHDRPAAGQGPHPAHLRARHDSSLSITGDPRSTRFRSAASSCMSLAETSLTITR